MKDKSLKIIMLGPPASGKGTQAKLFSQKFNIPHISAGDILRSVKDDVSNPLSKKVADLINNGKLVPDDMISQMIIDRIRQDDCKAGFILDGYPRTEEQFKTINRESNINHVLLIDVADEVVTERMAGRRTCPNGHIWHLKYSPTQKEGICDTCGEKVYIRDDDQEEKIKERLKIYHQNTDQIVVSFREENKLIKINGDQPIKKVFQDILKWL